MIPSDLDIIFRPNVIVVKNNNTDANIETPTSKFIEKSKGIDFIVAVVPKIKNTLKIFEPITFPTIISGFFFTAATIEVANSGSDVPTAIIVKPITFLDIPNKSAILTAPSIRYLPPKNNPNNPERINKVAFQRDMDLISS